MNLIKNKQKVFVGMSGGVDSSVTAALLKKRGFDVTGVFIKVWQPDFLPCTWKEERLDAMRVAAHLDIPFITMDLEKEYKREIVDYMVREYKAGRTPNPDVMCNKYVKFGAFFDKSISMGADYVATGHYARIAPCKGRSFTNLLVGVDENKDQSYFLWTLTQKQLQKTLFPIGEYEKPKVREMAKKFGLSTADKKDSQGLCFVGKLDMKEFLKEFIPEKKGDVLNEQGEVVGVHDGVYFYTLGQRHGFTITKKHPDDMAYFIVSKNVDKNTLTVSHKSNDGQLPHSKIEAVLSGINWISGNSPNMEKTYSARVRYRQPLQQCRISFNSSGGVKVIFENPQIINPGQSLVLYDEEDCLGGGIIV
jgi:tRNA-specific 2-thiouridylase